MESCEIPWPWNARPSRSRKEHAPLLPHCATAPRVDSTTASAVQYQSIATSAMMNSAIKHTVDGVDASDADASSLVPCHYREWLCGAGVILVAVGSMPCWVFVYPFAQAFDVVVTAMAAVFALLGLATVGLACIVVPANSTHVLVRTLKTPLIVVTAFATILVSSLVMQNDLAATWRSQSLVGFNHTTEAAFAHNVNTWYCLAKTTEICSSLTVDEAHKVFDLPLGSQAMDSDECASTASMSSPVLCQLCQTAARQPVQPHNARVLSHAVDHPSTAVMAWCTHKLVSSSGTASHDASASPYQQHRFALLALWPGARPEVQIKGAQLLSLLAAISSLCIAILHLWERNGACISDTEHMTLLIDV